jgi:hypothetical protein
MRTVKTPTRTPTDLTTTAAADAAQIVLGFVERLAPTADARPSAPTSTRRPRRSSGRWTRGPQPGTSSRA